MLLTDNHDKERSILSSMVNLIKYSSWHTQCSPNTFHQSYNLVDEAGDNRQIQWCNKITGVSIVYATVCSDADQTKYLTTSLWCWYIWGLCYQRLVSRTCINNCTQQNTVGCNYLSMSKIPAPGNKFITCDVASLFVTGTFSICKQVIVNVSITSTYCKMLACSIVFI